MERCMVCGGDDLIEFSNGTRCQRCGAMGGENGWEYDPDEMDERIDQYDEQFGE